MYGTKIELVKEKPVIYTKNNFALCEIVPDDKPSKIDPAGYVDPNIRIDAMVKAGIRLDEYNKAVYDYENADEQDDGTLMDDDRYDDINDTMLKGLHSLDRYRTEAYRQYKEFLRDKDKVQLEQSSQLREVNLEESVKQPMKA